MCFYLRTCYNCKYGPKNIIVERFLVQFVFYTGPNYFQANEKLERKRAENSYSNGDAGY